MLTESAVSTGHGQKKSRRRTIALAALLCHPTIKAAARVSGIAEVTLGRWLKDPQFAADYQSARENVLKLASDELKQGTLQAVSVLREVMANKKAPAASRVQAARSFLESTSLLKGVNLAINNKIVAPLDAEATNLQLVDTMRGLLQSDPWFREQIQTLAQDIEMENANGRLPN